MQQTTTTTIDICIVRKSEFGPLPLKRAWMYEHARGNGNGM